MAALIKAKMDKRDMVFVLIEAYEDKANDIIDQAESSDELRTELAAMYKALEEAIAAL